MRQQQWLEGRGWYGHILLNMPFSRELPPVPFHSAILHLSLPHHQLFGLSFTMAAIQFELLYLNDCTDNFVRM